MKPATSSAMPQSSLFPGIQESFASGFAYEADFLSPAEEALLLERIQRLPLAQAEYKQFRARRRIVSYGGQYDFVKILDYGLVKQVAPRKDTRDLTRGLRIVGTPLYMAPERLRDPADVDARADIYAVGAVAFLMLAGRRLFESSDDLELATKILNDEPPRASACAPQPVPLELDLIVTSCLEKKRELRPQRVLMLPEGTLDYMSEDMLELVALA